ncbi:MAG: DUF4352 domain-containing protein [Anaerolineae bacterium]|nr:DUF4352 domain-containing protein [Anaerolineae bacterium]
MLRLNSPRKKSILVTLITLLTLLLAACGGDAVEVETPTEEPAAEAVVQEVTEEVIVEVEQPDVTEETVAELEQPEAVEEATVETSAATDGWVEFISEEFGFSVLMPGEPEPMVQSLGAAAPGSDVSVFMYEGQANGRQYAYGTAYVALPIDLSGLSESELEEFFDESRDGGLQSMAATLVDEKPAPLQEYPGRLVEFTSDFMKGMNWFVLAENNLYQVMVLTSSLDEDFTEEDYAFLGSFTLHDTLPQPDFSAATAAVAAPETAQIASEAPAITTETTYALGDPIEFDNLIVTVNEISTYETDDIFAQPQEGNIFLLVNVTVQNNNNDTAYFLPITDTSIVDADGNSYEFSLVASALGEDVEFYEGEIPGETTHEGYIPYEVAESATGLTLVLDTTSYQDGGEVFIPLGGEFNN